MYFRVEYGKESMTNSLHSDRLTTGHVTGALRMRYYMASTVVTLGPYYE
jgi:hypothetical protein